ncbi:DNA replication/repair protein RecF [bacterium]|nr:DNA replication/repair protein RecF [bacterium]
MSRTLLAALKIRGFRNLAEVDLEPSPGVNVLWGDNAQGKSNTLEAVHFLATATSPRTFHISEVIARGAATAYVEGRLERPEGPETLGIGLDATRKLIRSNEARLARVQELYGRLPVVSFVPEDLAFVNGAPHDRRRLLDVALAQMEPPHVLRLLRYNRALRHRNSLLRAGRWSHPEMETWEEQLAALGAEIMRARAPLCRRLAERLTRLYQELFGGREMLGLRYHPSFACGDEEGLWPEPYWSGCASSARPTASAARLTPARIATIWTSTWRSAS